MTGTSTTTPTGTSPDRAATAQLAPSAARVLAALHRLGEATAAGTAAEAGLGYSTTTPKLRALENRGLAEPIRGDDGRTLWKLTDNGRAYAEQEQADDAGTDGTQPPTAGPGDAEASDTTAAAQNRRQPEGTPEPFDEEAAQADLPDEGTAASGHRADPPDPSPTDDSPGDEPGAQSGADAEAPACPAAKVPESGGPAAGTDAAAGAPAAPPAPAGGRRATGTLRGAILDILEANPGHRYKTGELCKLIDKANDGAGAKKASPGAVHNAAVKLVEAGQAVQVVDKPATFALAGTDTDSGAS